MKPAGISDTHLTADLQGPDRAALPYWQPVLAVLSGLLILALGTALPGRKARETPAAQVAAFSSTAAPAPDRRIYTDPELRIWTDRAGRQIAARLISATSNTLTLATPEGDQRTFARNAFSPADLAFVDWMLEPVQRRPIPEPGPYSSTIQPGPDLRPVPVPERSGVPSPALPHYSEQRDEEHSPQYPEQRDGDFAAPAPEYR